MSRNDESSLNMSDSRADLSSGSFASHAPRAGHGSLRPASLAPRRVLRFVLALALLTLVGFALYVYMPAHSKLHTHPKPHLQPQLPPEPPLQSPPASQPEPQPQPHPKPPSQPQERFPPVHTTDFRIHDPSIIRVGDAYYSYSVGKHIRIHQAPSLDGPWKRAGTVLEADSIIPKGDRKAPWAPQTIHYGDTYYCFYAVSNSGCRDSAIGVATSKSPGPGGWTDHGVLVQSGTGEGSEKRPFAGSNTIDPSVIVTPDGQGYLMFGSFWSGIWQVPLSKDLLSVSGDTPVEARQLVYMEEAPLPAGNNPNPLCRESSGARPIEGSFISYREPWYYLWFSYGKCCKFNVQNLPPPGREYSIRVGRSKNPRGPFVDKQGRDLAKGGGEVVYASNRDVYAPGGQGVLTEESGDILYYHYLNKSMSYEFGEARLGYNPLEYVDGWPVPQ